MKIELTTDADLLEIFKIYDQATLLQKQVGIKSWQGFQRSLLEHEIAEARHYKIIDDDQITATFVLAFQNKQIWNDIGQDKAVYIHRVATNADFRGRSYMSKIVLFAKEIAQEKNLNFIRLDTHSGNQKLTSYYEKCGFIDKGIKRIDWTPDLPIHYNDGPFSKFEMVLK